MKLFILGLLCGVVVGMALVLVVDYLTERSKGEVKP